MLYLSGFFGHFTINGKGAMQVPEGINILGKYVFPFCKIVKDLGSSRNNEFK